MILEFIGLPGAGKSTLIGPLINKVSDAGIKADNFASHNEKLMGSLSGKLKFISFVVFNGISIYKLRQEILKNGGKGKIISQRIYKLLILIFSIKEYCKKHSDTILILDQGLMQMIGSIWIEQNAGKALDSQKAFTFAVKMLSSNWGYKLIKVNASVETVSDRIYSRGKNNCEFKLMNREQLSDRLKLYENFINSAHSEVTVSSTNETVNENVTIIYNSLFTK